MDEHGPVHAEAGDMQKGSVSRKEVRQVSGSIPLGTRASLKRGWNWMNSQAID